MPQYDNRNQIAMWPNDRKRDEKDKDFTGNVTVSCPHCAAEAEFFVGVWDNGDDADGRRPRFKGSLQPKAGAGGAPARSAPASRAPLRSVPRGGGTGGRLPDDEIPFGPQRD